MVDGLVNRRARETGEIVDVAEVDAERSIGRLIVDQVAAGRAATHARRVINARLKTQH